jgi:hypothetical protein
MLTRREPLLLLLCWLGGRLARIKEAWGKGLAGGAGLWSRLLLRLR